MSATTATLVQRVTDFLSDEVGRLAKELAADEAASLDVLIDQMVAAGIGFTIEYLPAGVNERTGDATDAFFNFDSDVPKPEGYPEDEELWELYRTTATRQAMVAKARAQLGIEAPTLRLPAPRQQPAKRRGRPPAERIADTEPDGREVTQWRRPGARSFFRVGDVVVLHPSRPNKRDGFTTKIKAFHTDESGTVTSFSCKGTKGESRTLTVDRLKSRPRNQNIRT